MTLILGRGNRYIFVIAGVIIYLSSVYNPYSTYLSYVFLLLMSFWAVLKKPVVSEKVTVIILTIFCFVALITFLMNINLGTSISETRKVFVNSIILCALLTISSKNWILIIKSICIASVFASIISTVYFGLTFSRSEILGGPNLVGVNLALGFFWSMYMYYLTKSHKYIFCSGLIMLGILSTVSGRSLFFCFIIILIVFFLQGFFGFTKIIVRRKVNKLDFYKYCLSFLFVVLTYILVYIMLTRYLVDNYWAQYLIDKATNTDSSNNLVRIFLVNKGIEYYSFSGFFGSGLDSSRVFFYNDIGVATYTHNNFLELLIGVGPVGLLLYMLFVSSIVYRSIKIIVLKKIDCVACYFAIALFIGLMMLSFFMSLYSNLLVGISILAINNRVYYDSNWFGSLGKRFST